MVSPLEGLLPFVWSEGKNSIKVVGWRRVLERGETLISLIMADKRETRAMKPNKLLEALVEFEKKHQEMLHTRQDGGCDYKATVILEFSYMPNQRGFKSPYANIAWKLEGGQVKFGSPQHHVEAFV